jgi:hypothetical protein
MHLIIQHDHPVEASLADAAVSIGSSDKDAVCISDAGLMPAHANFVWQFDRRALLMRVAAGARAYVNGRPVAGLALLRAGDTIMLQHLRVDVRADVSSLIDTQTAMGLRSHVPAGAKVVVRCVAGVLFGQSFSLRQPLALLGGARVLQGGCDLTSAVMVYWCGDHALVLAGADASDIVVNGHVGRAGRLYSGDQLRVGDARYSLEAPGIVTQRSTHQDAITPVYGHRILSKTEDSTPALPTPQIPAETRRGLLITLAMAGLIAVILTALLLFVPH